MVQAASYEKVADAGLVVLGTACNAKDSVHCGFCLLFSSFNHLHRHPFTLIRHRPSSQSLHNRNVNHNPSPLDDRHGSLYYREEVTVKNPQLELKADTPLLMLLTLLLMRLLILMPALSSGTNQLAKMTNCNSQ
uniref:Uncharacterized protein n=1 Tax=Anopheles culicifacies TaxID=139723 RepID=A0A182LZB3_9DIPT